MNYNERKRTGERKAETLAFVGVRLIVACSRLSGSGANASEVKKTGDYTIPPHHFARACLH